MTPTLPLVGVVLEVAKMTERNNEDAYDEAQAAAGWPEPCSLADEIALDESWDRTQAYWASPEGIERQLADARAEREKWGHIRD